MCDLNRDSIGRSQALVLLDMYIEDPDFPNNYHYHPDYSRRNVQWTRFFENIIDVAEGRTPRHHPDSVWVKSDTPEPPFVCRRL